MRLHEVCSGRWREILSQFMDADYLDGKHHGCPKGCGKDRFRFSDKHHNGGYFCGCSDGKKDGFDLLMCLNDWDFKKTVIELEKIGIKDDGFEKKKLDPLPVIKEVVVEKSKYLASRGLETPPGIAFGYTAEDDAALLDTDRGKPVMVGKVRDGGGRLSGLHLTYLQGNRKRKTDAKKMYGRIKGGSIHLYRANGVLGVAEGIETAIAAKMLYDIPTWALMSTSIMKSFTPPHGTKELVVFADNDVHYAGYAAAYALANRIALSNIDVKVSVILPKLGDFNDDLLKR